MINHRFMEKSESQKSSLAAFKETLIYYSQKAEKSRGSDPELNYKGTRVLEKPEFSTTVSQLN